MIYLATPYTHADPAVMERRFQVVNRVAGDLMGNGEVVFSPISHGHPIAKCGVRVDWWQWKDLSERMLMACDRVIVLRQAGWEESIGVCAEIAIARKLGMDVSYFGSVEAEDEQSRNT